ncbi:MULTISPECIES: GNAT family N-acetyltransferase [Pontibacillus]|uniref:GNAT family N-acetyltransferase n=1 Tax=Pontibacillus chungwhensis TaxID=265426 RepID=A0ABY8USB1_9BACI|nr:MULTISPECIES: GNAT family N-acetyltransferase [Pontibacillus]MCD5323174.1 GNAT family N-acetyltransferase [Pontibacillus sp. HN14]WIF96561.1 GNAT family N-acetyltransferase [Pontibacillus chungwhensis]
MKVRFIPMKQETFEEYYQTSVREYANEHVEAGNWTASEAMINAQEQFESLLPDGLNTRDHDLFAVVNEEGKEIGMIWLHRQHRPEETHIFIYDIKLHNEEQGKGYGTAAMRALERYAESLNIVQIGLHVFAHNKRALHLYKKMGFETTDLVMKKRLSFE